MAPISYGAVPLILQEAPFVARRITFRLLVILTLLLAAAFNGGWKWDVIHH